MVKKGTMIRMPKELTKTLKSIKKYNRESYADIIKRLIKESKIK